MKTTTENNKQKITDLVKTFEDACKIEAPSPELTPLLSYQGTDKDMLAAKDWAEMNHIRKVLNEDWEPDWTNFDERKYYPWFDMSSGSGLSYYDCVYVYSASGLGSRLCYKSAELARYAGTQFIEKYKSFMTL